MAPSAGSDPIAALFERGHFGIKLGLDNIRALCAVLGHPERAAPSVIVAGTNGKGSVVAMVAAALSAGGYRTGRYTSPHLVSLEERFAIDNRPAASGQVSDALACAFAAERVLHEAGRLAVDATFFELATAAAFDLFRRAAVDIVVLEVGLGGRFDATNVAEPLVGAITTIDLDHTAHLGEGLPQIAFEKAGVIKPGMTVVVGERKPEALDVIERVAQEQGATLLRAWDGASARAEIADGRTFVTLQTPAHDYGRIPLGLGGRHQADNALVAVRVLESLSSRGFPVGTRAITHALTHTEWPGRLQLVELAGNRSVLLDAAHNVAGAATLAAYLREAWPVPAPLVFGVMRDKDARGMLAALGGSVSRVVFTAPPIDRAVAPRELLELARAIGLDAPAEAAPSIDEALARGFRHGPRVVVAGSIFLLGEVLPRLVPAAAPGSR
jgi:dihydrofolate synthase/folylpolyglutamate synthase